MLCVPLTGADCDRLALPPMHHTQRGPQADRVHGLGRRPGPGVTTGISAAERARTIRLLADPEAKAEDLTRPGHVFPLRAKEGGVLRRPGHTEAAVDLARLAGLRPAAAIGELVNDDGSMRGCRELVRVRRRARADADLDRRPDRVPDAHRAAGAPGRRGHGCRPGTASSPRSGTPPDLDGNEHVALVLGDIGDGEDVLVRVHSECLTGDVFGSLRCDCGPQLDAALAAVAAEGRGVVLYMRGHEGRGIGLLHKLQAYQLQDARRRHGRRQPARSACRPTPATTAPARRSWSTSACGPCGC